MHVSDSKEITIYLLGNLPSDGRKISIAGKLKLIARSKLKFIDRPIAGKLKVVDRPMAGKLKIVDRPMASKLKFVDRPIAGKLKSDDCPAI